MANGVKKRLGDITRKFRDEPLENMAGPLPFHYRWSQEFQQTDSEFDQAMGVDTKGPVGLWYLHIPSENVRHAIRYEGVDPSIFRRALGEIRDDLERFTFVDLGCGKGRALLIACEFGFARLIGVEFASELAMVARANCERAAVQAMVLAQDAMDFQFPPGNLVVYLYNPFGPSVLNPVLDHFLESTGAGSYVVYINPVHSRRCFDSRARLECLAKNDKYAVWRTVQRGSSKAT